MDWLKAYHEDHEAVLLLLSKLEGNVMDLKAGYPSPDPYLEFTEFAEVIRSVIIPHFKNEEITVYKEVAEKSSKGSAFIQHMLVEHEVLYSLFDNFFTAVDEKDNQKIIEVSGKLDTVLRHHIHQEEKDLPKYL